MKLRLLAFLALALLSTLNLQLSTCFAQGTAFTYQGRLNSGTNLATGSYDLTFALFSVSSGAGQVGGTMTNSLTPVSNGLFTVTLDFGVGVFPGADRWLEIGVRTNGGGTFATLSPRQKITPTPYAITASNLTGTVSAGGLAGTYSSAVTFNNAGNSFSGNGAGLTNLSGASIADGTVDTNDLSATVLSNTFWRLTGNSGTVSNTHFIGTRDNLPLDVRVNNQRVMRYQPDSISPNLIGGFSGNLVLGNIFGRVGAVIGGGGFSGGINMIGGTNIADGGDYAFIGGGGRNTNLGDFAFIGGGFQNFIDGSYTVIAGGQGNSALPWWSVIGGGISNSIDYSADYAAIAGGSNNRARSDGAAIGGGGNNLVDSVSQFSTIGGGAGNSIVERCSVIGGGISNRVDLFGINATIAGGSNNVAQGRGTAIGGGANNLVAFSSLFSTIPGGFNNFVDGNYSFAAGRQAKANHDGAFVWADSTGGDFASTAANQFLIRASGGVGIGTTAPEADLHIRGNSATGSLILTPNTSDSRSQVLLAENTSASLGVIMRYAGDVSGNPLYFIPLNSGAVEGAPIMTLERSGGNVGIGTTNPASALHVIGTVTATAFNPPSDRNLKENFTPVSPREMLDKVAGMPISRWNFKSDATTPHLGPMAQDFHAAFGLGTDDKHIATVDADGVALAAIQGLNEKVEVGRQRAEDRGQKAEDRMQKLEAENAELKARLEKLERLINEKSGGGK